MSFSITSIVPSTVSTIGGETVTVTGTGFVNPMTIQLHDGVMLAATYVSPTQVTFVAPAHASGTGAFTLGEFDSGFVLTYGLRVANAFTYIAGSVPSALGLARYYKLDGDGVDEAYGQNATATNIVWTTGKLGQGTDFHGGDKSRELVAPGLDIMTNMSIAFWAYLKGSSTFGPVVCHMVDGGGADTNYAILQEGHVVRLYGKNNNTAGAYSTLVLNTWTHVVMVRLTDGSVSCYTDGVLATSSGPNANIVPWSVPGASLRIGHRQDHYNVFDGIIDELGIWNRALSADEVSWLYNAGAGLAYPFPLPPPALTSVTPSTGDGAGGETVTLTGSDFVDGATVLFGSDAGTSVAFVDATSLTAVTPALPLGGVVDVTVTNPDTQASTLSGAFTFTAVPVIPPTPEPTASTTVSPVRNLLGEIAITWDAQNLSADFSVSANDLLSEQGLHTAVLLSLFTDRRAEPGDVLPTAEQDRRGWWADDADKIGSRLWLLARSKKTPDVLSRAEGYAREALQWLLDDSVLTKIDVVADWLPKWGTGLLLTITLYRPKQEPVKFRFDRVWAAEEARL